MVKSIRALFLWGPWGMGGAHGDHLKPAGVACLSQALWLTTTPSTCGYDCLCRCLLGLTTMPCAVLADDTVLGRLLRAQEGGTGSPSVYSAFLTRCFICRVRCLLDSTSGFLVSRQTLGGPSAIWGTSSLVRRRQEHLGWWEGELCVEDPAHKPAAPGLETSGAG
jgi:hypothetical protein